jgi:hypothetical protein
MLRERKYSSLPIFSLLTIFKPSFMWFKVFYGLAFLMIIIGVMLSNNQIATTHFNRGFGKSEEVVFSGSHIIFFGVVMLLAGLYIQKRNIGR